MLWHGAEPIGICVFATPAKSLRQRSRYFGLTGGWSRARLQALNAQLVTLSRVVLHPAYRGAGLAADFIRASCRSCRWPWIEALAGMGQLNPLFERAGFVEVGASQVRTGSRQKHSDLYGGHHGQDGRKKLISRESYEKSRYARPVYYVFDNRGVAGGDRESASG
jgi:hypothetical protein